METGRAALAAQHTSSGARVRLRPRSLRGGSAGRILRLLTGRGPARYAVRIAQPVSDIVALSEAARSKKAA